jgi:hypothetical protein
MMARSGETTMQQVNITLCLPLDGNGKDYVGAISRAIDQAARRGDRSSSDALAGLLAVIRLSYEGIEGIGPAALKPQRASAQPAPA